MRWSQLCFQAWDMLALSQWITKLNDDRLLSARIFCWQPPPQHCFCFHNIFWMRDAATILMDDLFPIIDLIYDFALALNASIEQQVPESARWWNHRSPATQQIFIFFLPKSKNAVFKYRPFAHLNISVLASWLSGIGGCYDTRGWQFDSWRGVLLRATFCSGGALLRQPSHSVVSDPFSCQIQNRDSEMKKAKRLLLLRRVLDRVYIFEWLVRLHVSLVCN